jgi:putative ubiquitin-RnfH superfamily antitoxin RatB of RatAB toxin-antitoxin module
MRIVVVYAAPGIEAQVEVILAPGAVVADAVTASALIDRHDLVSTDLTFAIYGQRVRPDTPLVDGDRIELLRPLLADPKELRRHRARGTPRTEVQTRGKKDTD